jgi:ABC-type transporter Mla subunit MlaD
MKDELLKKLESLKAEYQAGVRMLNELQTREQNLRQTLLQISGAIQVLEELLGESKNVEQEINELTDVKS